MKGPHSGAELSEAKAALRKELRAELGKLSPEDRASASEQVCERLRQTTVWRRAHAVLGYVPLSDEIDVFPLLDRARQEGRRIALPQFNPQAGAYVACQIYDRHKDLTPGKFGILEPGRHCPPVGMQELDLILVPGLAFDKDGHRLGRGRGFYDRLLASVSAVKCGLAFDQQVRVQIPVEPHDVLLDCIVTPGSWLEFSRQRHGDELVG